MIDKIISVFIMALVITGLGIAVRPGSQAPAIIKESLGGFAKIQTAAYGPK